MLIFGLHAKWVFAQHKYIKIDRDHIYFHQIVNGEVACTCIGTQFFMELT
jgi:hypothetical protein